MRQIAVDGGTRQLRQELPFPNQRLEHVGPSLLSFPINAGAGRERRKAAVGVRAWGRSRLKRVFTDWHYTLFGRRGTGFGYSPHFRKLPAESKP
jgi:hypothetical protein